MDAARKRSAAVLRLALGRALTGERALGQLLRHPGETSGRIRVARASGTCIVGRLHALLAALMRLLDNGLETIM
jgi:hypothetical protein